MTREEQAQYICEKLMENPEFRKAFVGAITDAVNEVVKVIKALEGEYIKVPKKALKYRTAGMIAYNAEWLKNHFDIERAVICGAQEPCADAISRQAVLKCFTLDNTKADVWNNIKALPPVTPTEKLEQEPCDDCISRQAAIKALKGWETVPVKVLEMFPPVTPAEKVGHWIIYDVHGHKACKCSECNNDVGYPCNDKFCKYCGAKMQEVKG